MFSRAQNQSSENGRIFLKKHGKSLPFLGILTFGAFSPGLCKMAPKQGPEAPKSSPGGSEIVPGGSKIDPGSSEIRKNLTFRNSSRNFARQCPDFCGQETEKGAQNRKTGSVLKTKKGSKIYSPEFFAEIRFFVFFRGEYRKTQEITRFRTLKSGKFTFSKHRKTRREIAAGRRESKKQPSRDFRGLQYYVGNTWFFMKKR